MTTVRELQPNWRYSKFKRNQFRRQVRVGVHFDLTNEHKNPDDPATATGRRCQNFYPRSPNPLVASIVNFHRTTQSLCCMFVAIDRKESLKSIARISSGESGCSTTWTRAVTSSRPVIEGLTVSPEVEQRTVHCAQTVATTERGQRLATGRPSKGLRISWGPP